MWLVHNRVFCQNWSFGYYIYIYVHIYTYVYMIYVCSVCIFIYIHSFKMLYTYLFHYIPFSFLNISNQKRSHLWLWDNLQQPPIFFSKNLQDLRGRSYERSSIALLADYFWDYTLYYPIDFSDHRYPWPASPVLNRWWNELWPRGTQSGASDHQGRLCEPAFCNST